MGKTYKLAIIPGDGTGPEVIAEGLKALQAAGKKFGLTYDTVTYDLGGARY
ncbi:isocitrate/isopropylmalate family dehydrogenase, partial [Klebsiella pneumoniae]|uniref:isocitrate/isopropylmalate family dehydrogenase n=1 Tax=Klebsiella pneumoniae TaxID=573 RepID=UPI002731255B